MAATGSSVYEQLFDVSGTRVVVTGAASGIGAAMAEVLADCGARVVLCDRDRDGLADRVAALGARGAAVQGVVADVVRINLTGVLLTMRAAARLMVPQRSGKIVVTASVAGLRADPMVGYSYLATKGGVVNVVRQAALELAHDQVTVNAIAPGPFKTNIGGKPHDDAAVAEWSRTVPLGRMASTDELKGLVLLLASKASSFMNGALIPIDGGALAAAPAM